MAACLQGRGYNTRVTEPYFGIRTDFPSLSDEARADAQKALDEASEECWQQVDPRRLEPPPPLSEDQLRWVYEYRLTVAHCLEDRGYPVPVAPSVDVFIESDGSWNPLGALARSGMPASREDQVACQDQPSRPGFLDW